MPRLIMTDLLEVAISASAEVDEVLADNGTDIITLLRKEGIEVQRGISTVATPEDSGLKEPVTIILATAALIATLTPVITKAINALSRKQIVITTTVLAPVETSDGRVVCDADGNPILQRVEKTEILEGATRPADSMSVSIETPIGLKFSFKAESHG
jgi:hypothetical protein